MAVISTQFLDDLATENAIGTAFDALSPQQAFNAFGDFTDGLTAGAVIDNIPSKTNIHISGTINGSGAIFDLIGNNLTAATTTATVLRVDYENDQLFTTEHLVATTGAPGTNGGISIVKSGPTAGTVTGSVLDFDYHFANNLIGDFTHIQFHGTASVTGALTVKTLLYDFNSSTDANDISIKIGSTAGITFSANGTPTGGFLNSATLTVGADHETITATGLNVAATAFFANGVTTAQQFNLLISGNDSITGALADGQTIFGGAGHDSILGGGSNDSIDGGSGNDTLVSGGDGTTLVGGTGNDFIDAGNFVGQSITEDSSPGGGIDTVRMAGDIDLATFSGGGFENAIEVSETYGNLYGNASNNVLTGGDVGNAWLDGRAGADTMTGGLGNDYYIVDNVGDKLGAEAVSGGHDTVYATVNWILGANYDELELDGTANLNGTGNAIDNDLDGNSGNNVLSGLDGNDDIDGGGGNDVLNGGLGNDSIIAGGGNDTINAGDGDNSIVAGEGINNIVAGSGNDAITSGGGNDSISSGAGNDVINAGNGANSIAAGAGDDVVVTGFGNDKIDGGDGNDNIDGGEGADVLTGGAGDDFISGGPGGGDSIDGGTGSDVLLASGASTIVGGAGDDTIGGAFSGAKVDGGDGNDQISDGGNTNSTLLGGLGNDTIQTDTLTDSIVGGAGIDQVEYTGNGGTITLEGTTENLRLTNGEGTTGIGNALANTLTSDFGYNTLDGLLGNDTYNVRSGDFVQETNNSQHGGTDLVIFNGNTSESIQLGEGIENLTTFGDSVTGSGNGLGNVLTNGGEGTAETFFGNAGNDTYNVFSSDFVVESSDTAFGTADLVNASLNGGETWNLGEGVENLTLVALEGGTLTGNGSSHNNVITGATTANNILNGNFGDDTLIGGAGGDSLSGGDGNNSESGGAGDDIIYAGLGNDSADGGAGNDFIIGDAGNDSLVGGTGDDYLQGDAGNDNLTGGDGNDNLYGGEGINNLNGGAGNDWLDGGSVAGNTLVGGAGDDGFERYLLNSGGVVSLISDSMDGGTGIDTVFLQGTGDNSIGTLALNMTQPGFGNIENINAGEASFSIAFNITGNGLNNALTGGGGNDTLSGGIGNDSLYGGGGNDSLVGGDGNDWLEGGPGVDALVGGAGDDSYVLALTNTVHLFEGFPTSSGDISLDTSEVSDTGGSDTLVLVGGSGNTPFAPFNYDLGNNSINTVPFENIDASGADSAIAFNLTGTAGNNRLIGGSNVDTLTGGAGNDTYGVTFDNTMGGDQIVGENSAGGTDLVVASLTDGQTWNLGEGLENLTLIDAGPASLLYGQGNTLNNVITGASNPGAYNALNGNDGNDTLIGGVESDQLNGGNGNDSISGGAGNDYLQGDAGLDTLVGGLGDDHYVVNLKALAAGTLEDTVTDTGGVNDSLEVIGNNTVTSFSYTLATIENLDLDGGVGSHINATITGGAADNYVITSFGNDSISGMAGNDHLDGGEGGNDTLLGGAGNDSLDGGEGNVQSGGNDSLSGGDGNDQIYAGSGNDTVLGGAGNDFIDGGSNNTMLGGGNDSLSGGDGDDVIYAGSGNDTVLGGAGNDFLDGGSTNTIGGGNNSLDGGLGNDTYTGGNGDDVMVFAQAGDVLTGDSGGTDTAIFSVVSTQFAGEGTNVIDLNKDGATSEIENVTWLGAGGVTILGESYYFNAIANVFTGGAGNDMLDGAEGADTLIGNAGNDTLFGGVEGPPRRRRGQRPPRWRRGFGHADRRRRRRLALRRSE